MTGPHPRRPRHHGRHGIALIEVLVSLAVLAGGLLGLLRLQNGLRASADLAAQRSTALRLAQDDLEGLRGAAAGQVIAPARSTWNPDAANATYTLTRVVQAHRPNLTQVRTELTWTDRGGAPQSLALTTLFAGLDPALSGALLLPRQATSAAAAAGTAAGRSGLQRHALLPVEALSLGDGRSAYRPRASEARVWVFDDASGEVVARCDSATGLGAPPLTSATLGTCRAIAGLFIFGRVRFATDTPTPGRTEAENPLSLARDLDLRLQLAGSSDPATAAWECSDDSADVVAAGGRVVHYLCVIQTAGPTPQWSGRLDLVPIGWTVDAATGDTANALRVCRYSADHDRNGRIDNAEHPASYSQVTSALGDQNFLVIRATAPACPSDSGVATRTEVITALHSNWIDDSTVAHAP